MATVLGVRGFNPIWFEVDLQSNHFDDSFYLFVLENTFPYVPATVYHYPNLTVPWTQPIRFLANGTLPIDIFFEVDHVYRLEFRKGPTQAYPLIYEVNDYMATGGGGNNPVENDTFPSGNQITNPQFALTNFETTITISATNPDPIQVAPGWDLLAAGTGTVTLTKTPLNNDNINPTNAPYALRLTLSGWTTGTVFLRQRFEQNGMLWTLKNVSTSITAKLELLPQEISAKLVDSNDVLLATVLDPIAVNASWQEFTDHALLAAPTNPDIPPAAYIDYLLALPSNVDIYVTSIQLIVQSSADESEPTFEQDSINRQIDHTFNIYKDELSFKQIPSILTAWDFASNPAQFGVSKSVSGTPAYAWDQTVMMSRVNNVAVVRQANTGALQFTTAAADESILIMQYLSGEEALRTTMSNLAVNLQMYSTNHSNVVVNVALFYSSAGGTIPSLLTAPSIIGTLGAAGAFTLTASGWTQIPQYLGFNSSASVSMTPNEDIQFSGFNGASNFNISAVNNFAIVITFSAPTNGTVVEIQSISLTPGDIATRPAIQSFDEVLRECRHYYEKSWGQGVAIGTATYNDAIVVTQGAQPSIQLAVNAAMTIRYFFNQEAFEVMYKTSKRSAAIFTFYSTQGSAIAGNVSCLIGWKNSNPSTSSSRADAVVASFWTQSGTGKEGVCYDIIVANLNTTIVQGPSQTVVSTSYYFASSEMSFHYTADARLGYV